MSSLVPCPRCSRHIRLTSGECPFCASALDVTALARQHAPRRASIHAGLKRAAAFALGTTVAAACGGRTESSPDDGLLEPLSTWSNDTSNGTTSVTPRTEAPTVPLTPTTPTTPRPTTNPSMSTVDNHPVTPPTMGPITDSTTDWGQPVYGAPVTSDWVTSSAAPTDGASTGLVDDSTESWSTTDHSSEETDTSGTGHSDHSTIPGPVDGVDAGPWETSDDVIDGGAAPDAAL